MIIRLLSLYYECLRWWSQTSLTPSLWRHRSWHELENWFLKIGFGFGAKKQMTAPGAAVRWERRVCLFCIEAQPWDATKKMAMHIAARNQSLMFKLLFHFLSKICGLVMIKSYRVWRRCVVRGGECVPCHLKNRRPWLHMLRLASVGLGSDGECQNIPQGVRGMHQYFLGNDVGLGKNYYCYAKRCV